MTTTRMMRASGLALAAVMTLAVLAAPRAGAQEMGIDVGSKAPAAQVQTLDGKTVDLSQFLGREPVLIEFWATWCPNCRALEPQMLAAAKKYAGKVGFVTVAVSVNQSPELVKRYAEKHGLVHEIVYDTHGDAVGAYQVPATSYVVVIDRAGKVVYTGLGGDQNLEAAIRKAM